MTRGDLTDLSPAHHTHRRSLISSMKASMTIASDLLQWHVQTLVNDNIRWQMLIDDNIVSELAYAAAIGHPTRLSGREEVVRHVTWFLGAVENFRFFDLKVFPMADPEGAVGQVMAEGTIKSTGRTYQQDMCCSCARWVARLFSCENILILRVRR